MTREDKDAIIRRLEAMYGEAEDNETKEALFYSIEALKNLECLSDDYKVGDKEHNVKVAVKKIREAYLSNDYKKMRFNL